MRAKIIALGAILALTGVACGGGDNNAGDATTTPTGTATTPQGGGASIGVDGLDFVPETLEVSTGTEVTWSWSGSVPHNAVARDGSFTSGEAVNNDTLTHTFNTAGTYEYVCEVHESAGMIGKVVVS